MCGKCRASSKQMLVPRMRWPSDRCCGGAASWKGLADKQKPLNLRAEGRREGRQKGGGLQRLWKPHLSKGGPRKTMALTLLFLSFEREPRSPRQLSTSHAWSPRSQEVMEGQRKAQEVVGLGCDRAILRCLIWCLSAISANAGGWATAKPLEQAAFLSLLQRRQSNEGIQMLVREVWCKYRLQRWQRARSGGGFTFTAGCNKRKRFFFSPPALRKGEARLIKMEMF